MGRKGFCCFLWLGFMCGAFRCQVCPRAEDISPCICKQDPILSKTTCANITSMNTLYEVFGKSVDFPISRFVLRNSNITYLPYSTVADKFTGLEIQNTNMVSLFDGQPRKTNKLYHFRLDNVRLQRGLQWNVFSSFTNLVFVYINNMEVKKLGQEFKDNIHKGLQYLVMSNSKTADLENGVLDELADLKWLEIRDAEIRSLKRSLLPNPSKLCVLDFRGNAIKTLPDDMFVNMPDLEFIYLDGNPLTVFPEAIYGPIYLIQERELSIQGNPIICDSRLKWLFSRLNSKAIHSRCTEPPPMKSKSIIDMKEKDLTYYHVTWPAFLGH